MLMEAHILVKYGAQVRHSKNAAETKKFMYYLFAEQRAQAPLLYPAIPVAAPVAGTCRAAAGTMTSPRTPHNASDRDLIILDDSPPEITTQANHFPSRAQPKARAVAACTGDKAPQQKKKRKAKQTETNPDRDPFALEDSPDESSPKRRATGARASVTAFDYPTQSSADEDAVQELMRVLESAKVVPDVSRQLFASSLIKCGVSSLQALRDGLAAQPPGLDLKLDVGMNAMQQGCLMRWLENRP